MMLSRWASFGPGQVGLAIHLYPTPAERPTSYPVLDKSALSSYLLQSGGLLNIAEQDPFNRYIVESTRVDISSQHEIFDRLRIELQGIGKTLAEIDIREEGRDRRLQLTELRQAINAAISAAAANEGPAWIANLLGTLEGVGKAAGQVYAGYSTGDAATVVDGLGKLIGSIDAMNAVWLAYGTGGEAIPQLTQRLQDLERSYQAFLSKAAETRQGFATTKLRLLQRAMQSRASFERKLEVRFAQYHDLLRLTFISYRTDPSRDSRILRNNLISIATFLQDFPAVEPYFRFRALQSDCYPRSSSPAPSGKDESCLRLEASSKWRVISWRFTLPNGTSSDVPLYVVAPSNLPQAFALYGLPYEVKTFENAPVLWTAGKLRF